MAPGAGAAVRTVALSGPAVWDAPGMDDPMDPWELHAGWWQEGFTDSADPEYTEQILPLAADLLAGYDRVLDVGTGEGQVSRVAVAGGASTTIGMDPAAAQVLEAVARGGGPAYLRAGADRKSVV